MSVAIKLPLPIFSPISIIFVINNNNNNNDDDDNNDNNSSYEGMFNTNITAYTWIMILLHWLLKLEVNSKIKNVITIDYKQILIIKIIKFCYYRLSTDVDY